MENKIRILVLYYSQTGKTKSVLDTFLQPLVKRTDVEITTEEIRPKTPFPFPWPKLYFFSIVPESVYEIPTDLEMPKFDENVKYDLIILGCQVWFLSPSIPISSLLQHPKAKVFQNTPVITVLFCRKMWRQTQGRIEIKLKELNSWVIDRVVVTAQGSQMKTLKATKHNLFQKATREEDAEWKASRDVLEVTARQGEQLTQSLSQIKADPHKSVLTDSSLAFNDTLYIFPEQKAKESFLFWSKYLVKYSKPDSKLRKILTIVVALQLFFKILVLLPLHPILNRLRKLSGKDDSQVKIVEIPRW